MDECVLLNQHYVVFVQIVADCPVNPPPPPVQIAVFVCFLPSLWGPFVQGSRQVASLSAVTPCVEEVRCD